MLAEKLILVIFIPIILIFLMPEYYYVFLVTLYTIIFPAIIITHYYAFRSIIGLAHLLYLPVIVFAVVISGAASAYLYFASTIMGMIFAQLLLKNNDVIVKPLTKQPLFLCVIFTLFGMLYLYFYTQSTNVDMGSIFGEASINMLSGVYYSIGMMYVIYFLHIELNNYLSKNYTYTSNLIQYIVVTGALAIINIAIFYWTGTRSVLFLLPCLALLFILQSRKYKNYRNVIILLAGLLMFFLYAEGKLSGFLSSLAPGRNSFLELINSEFGLSSTRVKQAINFIEYGANIIYVCSDCIAKQSYSSIINFLIFAMPFSILYFSFIALAFLSLLFMLRKGMFLIGIVGLSAFVSNSLYVLLQPDAFPLITYTTLLIYLCFKLPKILKFS